MMEELQKYCLYQDKKRSAHPLKIPLMKNRQTPLLESVYLASFSKKIVNYEKTTFLRISLTVIIY